MPSQVGALRERQLMAACAQAGSALSMPGCEQPRAGTSLGLGSRGPVGVMTGKWIALGFWRLSQLLCVPQGSNVLLWRLRAVAIRRCVAWLCRQTPTSPFPDAINASEYAFVHG